MTGRPRALTSHAHLATVGLMALAGLAAAASSLAACIPSVARTGSAGPVGSPNEPAATTTPSPVPAPSGPAPVPSFVRPTPTPAPTFLLYVVKPGDNLNTIAHQFGTTGRSIAYWNRATYPSLNPEAKDYRPNLIRIGWSLVLIPNVTVDEQGLPQPTPNPTDP
jgi:hypothetical protein